jgi:hypothetical protein
VSGDLTARVAELAALIEKQLSEDEAWAKVAAEVDGTGKWEPAHRPEMGADYRFIAIDSCQVRIQATDAGTVIHAARHDPARTLRRDEATRDLVAEILAERHQYVDGDPWFSCSQATEPGEDDSEPGSACADDERRGKPCDCGRDSRVARLLGIIAGEWEG